MNPDGNICPTSTRMPHEVAPEVFRETALFTVNYRVLGLSSGVFKIKSLNLHSALLIVNRFNREAVANNQRITYVLVDI